MVGSKVYSINNNTVVRVKVYSTILSFIVVRSHMSNPFYNDIIIKVKQECCLFVEESNLMHSLKLGIETPSFGLLAMLPGDEDAPISAQPRSRGGPGLV